MLAGSDDLLGWNGTHTGYVCADGVEVPVKRQETVRFTKKERIQDSRPM